MNQVMKTEPASFSLSSYLRFGGRTSYTSVYNSSEFWWSGKY